MTDGLQHLWWTRLVAARTLAVVTTAEPTR
ncbi:hypothetical protein FHR81_005259 [Actinoalloteichus hoggarensis]|nr:hypothetical protein [Actinoalloteichus hoggarensis]